MVLRKLDLRTEFKQTFADEAAAVTFSGLQGKDFATLCESIAQVVGDGKPLPGSAGPVRHAVSVRAVAGAAATSTAVQPRTEEAYAVLQKAIVGVAGPDNPVMVTVEFGGMPMRGRMVAADAEGITATLAGNMMPIKWGDMRPVRFYELAARVSEDDADPHMWLAHYCLGNGLLKEGLSELEKAEEAGGPKEEIAGLREYAGPEK